MLVKLTISNRNLSLVEKLVVHSNAQVSVFVSIPSFPARGGMMWITQTGEGIWINQGEYNESFTPIKFERNKKT